MEFPSIKVHNQNNPCIYFVPKTLLPLKVFSKFNLQKSEDLMDDAGMGHQELF